MEISPWWVRFFSRRVCRQARQISQIEYADLADLEFRGICGKTVPLTNAPVLIPDASPSPHDKYIENQAENTDLHWQTI